MTDGFQCEIDNCIFWTGQWLCKLIIVFSGLISGYAKLKIVVYGLSSAYAKLIIVFYGLISAYANLIIAFYGLISGFYKIDNCIFLSDVRNAELSTQNHTKLLCSQQVKIAYYYFLATIGGSVSTTASILLSLIHLKY